jgi:hypothetical protein
MRNQFIRQRHVSSATCFHQRGRLLFVNVVDRNSAREQVPHEGKVIGAACAQESVVPRRMIDGFRRYHLNDIQPTQLTQPFKYGIRTGGVRSVKRENATRRTALQQVVDHVIVRRKMLRPHHSAPLHIVRVLLYDARARRNHRIHRIRVSRGVFVRAEQLNHSFHRAVATRAFVLDVNGFRRENVRRGSVLPVVRLLRHSRL